MSNTTELFALLSNPTFKKGLIVAPALSGKTYALCNKAVLNTLQGEFVLLVTPSKAVACGRGGVHEILKVQLEGNLVKYRYSPESGIYQVGLGKLKVVTEDFVLEGSDLRPDTVIYTETVPYTSQQKRVTNTIRCTSHYQLSEHRREAYYEGDVKIRRNLAGKEVDMSLQYPFDSEGEFVSPVTVGTLSYAVNSNGRFVIEVGEPSQLLADQNEIYIQYLNGLDPITKTRLTCTNFAECIKIVEAVQDEKQRRESEPSLIERVASIEETLGRIESFLLQPHK